MAVIGDQVWGVELDDADVPTLVRWRMRKQCACGAKA
jgi:hypothetical protein